MAIGMILLIVVSILIFAGLAERVLDRLRLSDKAAIAIIIAIVVSTIFLPDINVTENVSFNVGGFVIPVALAIYLFIKAETGKERWRAVIAAVVAGGVIYATQRYILPAEPEAQNIEPNYVYAIIAGIIAYVLGRSRRAAFIAGVMGVVITDIIQMVINAINNIPAPTRFGGAGGVDTTVIAGVLAVLLAEIIGEIRERLQGGTEKKEMHFEKGHFVSTLGESEKKSQKDDEEKRGDKDEK
ncbi:DUF1614 domain-containing protein [Clostridium formicaceticum]|uniref:DUF1614 domain-containing protein n=1 Tax=Clostridium formicaceticum TaxID=1497 RepID=A0AAC9RLQ4_9CLOT|nr:DUF1614 domain-containing protein [Clostridium formicaceticum]AOY77413.1 hypothetical protein BJL90_17090 [Clostridium formicaceticum]ARE87967.1 hypothetical protein CLFO_23680 [Clostridium formicaceticum]